MTTKVKILFFLLVMICNSAFSHKSTYFKKTFGNIELVCSTFYYTEDMNKYLIIGQYAQYLSELLKYNSQIRVVLNQDETTKFYAWRKDISQNDESANLNIMIDSSEKDVSKCLSFIEKAILNRDKLKQEKNNLQNWYSANLSSNVLEVLKIKVYRPNDIQQLPETKFFNYYFQDNYFHVVTTKATCETNEVGVFSDIIQFVEPKFNTLCMFTTKNTLKIFETSCPYSIEDQKTHFKLESSELKIEKRMDYFTSFRPFKISSIGKTNLIIESLWGEDMYFYSLSKKIFIEDLEKQIEK